MHGGICGVHDLDAASILARESTQQITREEAQEEKAGAERLAEKALEGDQAGSGLITSVSVNGMQQWIDSTIIEGSLVWHSQRQLGTLRGL